MSFDSDRLNVYSPYNIPQYNTQFVLNDLQFHLVKYSVSRIVDTMLYSFFN